jgi:DNA-binding transcriptional regulator GbsR (MarR family)
MKFFEQIEFTSRICQSIKMKATGSPKEFAHRLGISERHLYRFIEQLKDVGIKIAFCKQRNSYYFENDAFVRFSMSVIENGHERKIVGGKNYLQKLYINLRNDEKWQPQSLSLHQVKS